MAPAGLLLVIEISCINQAKSAGLVAACSSFPAPENLVYVNCLFSCKFCSSLKWLNFLSNAINLLIKFYYSNSGFCASWFFFSQTQETPQVEILLTHEESCAFYRIFFKKKTERLRLSAPACATSN
jgi:hypothetical protein